MAEYDTYIANKRIYIGNALAFNVGDWVPVSHVTGGIVSLSDVQLAPGVPAPVVDVFDGRVSGLIGSNTATRDALRAALAAADPVLSAFSYDATTGNLLSYQEDGITITLTYNSDGTVATSKRGSAATKTFAYSGGNLTGVA